MQSKPKHRILQNTAILFAGQLVTWSLSIVFTVYVPRRVGNVGWGELSLATAFTSLASMLVGLGMGTLMVRDIAQDRSKAADMIGTALLVELVLLLPTLFLMVLVA